MRKTSLIALILLLIASIISCKNAPKKEIVIGNSDGMLVYFYDTLDYQHDEYEYEDVWYYRIDLNQDGIDDIELYADEIPQSPYADSAKNYGISCLNEHIVLCCKLVETTYYIHTDTLHNEQNESSIIHIEKIYTASKIEETDSIEGTKEELLLDFDKEHLCTNDFFYPYDYSFYESGFIHNYTLTKSGINYHITNHYLRDYLIFETEGEKYIGFKYIDDKRERLGWIKFALEPEETGFHIKLLETAIQE